MPSPAPIKEEHDEQQQLTPTAEPLRANYKLSHLPFSQIQLMAANGHLPKRLIDCRVPCCTSCLFGRATKTPWRKDLSKIKVATEPGQCVSIDQLELPTPGLLAQLKGTPTLWQYRAATVFVNHFSQLSFVHLQQTLSSEDTLLAKQAFEQFCSTHGMKVLQYHADNGRFADNAFLTNVRQQNQLVTYCGLNTHFQNGVAEKQIQDLQDHTCTLLLHATAHWPAAVSTYLWPYALRTANDVLVSAPRRKDGKSAMEIFCKTAVSLKVKKFCPFGCPVYILNSDLQAGKKFDKWYSRAHVGIYLEKSPRHARTVALILNVQTGLVSPQFCIKFDNLFETVPELAGRDISWQTVCHFNKTPKKASVQASKGASLVAAKHSAVSVVVRDAAPIPVPPEPPPDDFVIPLDQGSGTKTSEQEVIVPPATQLPAATGAGCQAQAFKATARKY